MYDRPHITPSELASYLDDELGPARHRAVAEHVSLCDTCHQALASMMRGQSAVRALAPVSAEEVRWLGPPSESRTLRPLWSRRPVAAWLAIAAMTTTIAIAFSAVTPSGSRPDTRQTRSAALDLGLLLTDLDHPTGTPRFSSAYRIEPASFDAAVTEADLLSREILDRIPSDYVLEKARLISGPLINPAALLDYEGPEGRVLVICQTRGSRTAFSGFEPRLLEILGTECTSVYCSRFKAIRLTVDGDVFTAVGPRNGFSVERLAQVLLGAE
jgi:hypothetical protein